MGKSLFAQTGNTSDIVTAESQTVGVFDPVFRVDPNDGTLVRLMNAVATGAAPGVPIYMDLQDGGGAQLADNTELRLVLDVAGQPQNLVVSEVITNIGSWNRLTLSEQQNEDNIDAVKVELEEPGSDQNVSQVRFRDVDQLRLELNGPDQFDPANSTIIIDKDAVSVEQR